MARRFFDIAGRDVTVFDAGAADHLCPVRLPDLYEPDASGRIRVRYGDRTDALARQVDLCGNMRDNCRTLVTLTPQTDIPIGVMARILRPAVEQCDATGDELTQHIVLRYRSDKQPPDDILPHARRLYADFRTAQTICRLTNALRRRCEPEAEPEPVCLPVPCITI